MGRMGRSGGLFGQGGGLGGSGIFGMIGTVVHCDNNDESWYCLIMKMFNLLIVFLVVISILTVVYNYLSTTSLFRKKLK
jgi:hypothetical protein